MSQSKNNTAKKKTKSAKKRICPNKTKTKLKGIKCGNPEDTKQLSA